MSEHTELVKTIESNGASVTSHLTNIYEQQYALASKMADNYYMTGRVLDAILAVRGVLEQQNALLERLVDAFSGSIEHG